MSECKDCSALRGKIVLPGRKKDGTLKRFIKENQHLESVLGPSNCSWFEDATRRKLQQIIVPRSFDSVIDSPVLTPRISQICTQELSVGSTPDTSSYSPKTVGRLLSFQPYRSTPDTLYKPLLGNSPCLGSPIGFGVGPSQPCPTIAQSLGVNVDESALNWTNSLATPTKDPSFVTDESPAESGKTKELARALFSPSKKLDTSSDSIKPLDSTCEDEQCDISADHDLSKSVDDDSYKHCDVSALDGSGKVLKGECLKNEVKSADQDTVISNYSQNNSKSKPTVIDNSGRSIKLKRIFKRRSPALRHSETGVSLNLSKPGSTDSPDSKLQTLSPLQNLVNNDIRQNLSSSLNESSLLADLDTSMPSVDKVMKQTVDMNADPVNQLCTPKQPDVVTDGHHSPTASSKENEDMTSPVFSQKSSKLKVKMTSHYSGKVKSPCSIDNALSDFFDPPSGAVGRRKRAPMKRKSIEIDTSSEFEISDVDIKCSTPKEVPVLHSILSSNKREKRSNKKVRFSDLHEPVAKKVTFSFENQVIEAFTNKTNSHSNNMDGSIISTLAGTTELDTDVKLNTNETTMKNKTHSDNFKPEKDLTCSNRTEVELQVTEGGKKEKQTTARQGINVTKCNEIVGKIEKKEASFSIDKKNTLKIGFNNEKDTKNSFKMCNSEADTILIPKLEENSSAVGNHGSLTDENDEFSQVSPSALKQMCHVADSSYLDASAEKCSSVSPTNNTTEVLVNISGPQSLKSNSEKKLGKEEKGSIEKERSSLEQDGSDISLSKGISLAVPKKFFYPSKKQIVTACPKKVFAYRNDRNNDGSSLVKSVSLSDLVQESKGINKDGEVLTGPPDMASDSGHQPAVNHRVNDGRSLVKSVSLSDLVQESKGRNKDGEVVTGPVDMASDSGHQPAANDRVNDGSSLVKSVSLSDLVQGSKGINKDEEVLTGPVDVAAEPAVNDTENKELGRNTSRKLYTIKDKAASTSTVLPSYDPTTGITQDINFHQSENSAAVINAESSKGTTEILAEVTSSSIQMAPLKSAVNNDSISKENNKTTVVEGLCRDYTKMIECVKSEQAIQSLCGFKLASGNAVKLEETALKKAEEMLNEINGECTKVSKTHTNGIKVSSQSMVKAQELISNATTSPKESKLSTEATNGNFIQNDKVGAINVTNFEEDENDIEFSQWYEEMEQLENDKSESRPSSLSEDIGLITNESAEKVNGKNDNNSTAMQVLASCGAGTLRNGSVSEEKEIESQVGDIDIHLERVSHVVKDTYVKDEIESRKNEMAKTNEEKRDQELITTGSTAFGGFSTAGGKELHISNNALSKAQQLMSDPSEGDTHFFIKGKEKGAELCNDTGRRECNGDFDRREKRKNLGDFNSVENSGFKTASGKKLKVSNASIMKATDLIDSCYEFNIDSKSKKETTIGKPNVNPAYLREDKSLNMPHSTSTMPPVLVNTHTSKSISPECVNKETTSSYSGNSNHQVLPSVDNAVEGGFKGFESASGKQYNLTNLSLKKAATFLTENASLDNCENTKLGDKFCKILVNANNEIGSTAFTEDLGQKVPKLDSIEEELKNLISLKEKKVCSKTYDDKQKPSAYAYPGSFEKRSTHGFGANVPKGFRPFKAPKIMKHKEQTVPNAQCDQETELKMMNENTYQTEMKNDVNVCLMPLDTQKNVIQRDLSNNEEQGYQNCPEDNLNSNSYKSSSDKNVEIKFDANVKEGLKQSNDIDSKECYDGLFSQMFAEDMEPSEMDSLKTLSHASIGKDSCEKNENIPVTTKTEVNAMKDIGKACSSTDLLFNGFSTASGIKVNIKAESLSKAAYLLDSSQELDLSKNLQKAISKSNLDKEGKLNLGRPSKEHEAMDQEVPGKGTFTLFRTPDIKTSGQTSKSSLNEAVSNQTNDSLFQTAHGKNISVPVKTHECFTILDQNQTGNHDEFYEKELDIKRKSEASVNVAEKANTETIIRGNEEGNQVVPNDGFDVLCQAADGEHVAISNECLGSVQKQLIVSENNLFPNNGCVPTFQTACDRTVAISKVAPKVVEECLEDSETKNTEMESECDAMFQTAASRNENISSNYLTAAKDGFGDSEASTTQFDSNVECKPMFQTASGRTVRVSEKSLYASKERFENSEAIATQINSKTDCIPMFQTASGITVNVSEKSLKAAKECLTNSEASSIQMDSKTECKPMFQIASDRTVHDPEKSLNVDKQCLEDSEARATQFDSKTECKPMFQTASGRTVHVSEKSLKAAKECLGDSEATAMQMNSKTEFKPMFQTASGRTVHVSENSLKAAKECLGDSEATAMQMNSKTEFKPMFQTASGRTVHVSENSLKAAKECLGDSEATAMQMNSKTEFKPMFQTASGRTVNVSENSLKAAKECLGDSEATAMQMNSKTESKPMFQTASGRTVNISENSLKVAKECLGDSEATAMQMNSKTEFKPMFQTASGRTVNVSENSLKAAKEYLGDSEATAMQMNSKTESKPMFQTASGRTVNISENSLKVAKECLGDSEATAMQMNSKTEFKPMFQTASGRTVNVSENSLKAAKECLGDSEATAMQMNSKTEFKPMFQTASGRTVNISENSLKAAKECLGDSEATAMQMNSKTEFKPMFQTTSGRTVNISENSLKAAKECLGDSEATAMQMNSKTEFKHMFQTASGRTVSISENSLKVAKECLGDSEATAMQMNSKTEFKPVFQTASGRTVNISENSLKAAKECLGDSEATAMQMNSKTEFKPMFQTASGRTVNISENSLKVAKEYLGDSEATAMLMNSKTEFKPMFQTASGRTVNVSENSLQAAKECLGDSEANVKLSKTVFGNIFEETGREAQKLIQLDTKSNLFTSENCGLTAKEYNSCSLFQTANGRSVDVSSAALNIARKNLLETSVEGTPSRSTSSPTKCHDIEFKSIRQQKTEAGKFSDNLSNMKRNYPFSEDEPSQIKRWKSGLNDHSEFEETPAKRQKLNDMDDSSYSKQSSAHGDQSGSRIPLRSCPEGLLTDRRCTGAFNRGLKPVHSHSMFKPPARTMLNELTRSAPKDTPKTGTPTKPSFQTPYKTTPKKIADTPPNLTAIPVHAPVFGSKTPTKSLQSATGKGTPQKQKYHTQSNQLSSNCDVSVHNSVSEDRTKSEREKPGQRTSLSMVHGSDNESNFRIGNTIHDMNQIGGSVQIPPKQSLLNNFDKSHHMEIGENLEKRKEIDMNIDAVKAIVSKDSTGDEVDVGEAINEGEFGDKTDTCMINDEAEMFYCDLFEARRYQTELIEQKKRMKIQPSPGRLYRQKQATGRWKLKDFVMTLKNHNQKPCIPFRHIGVTSATAKDYQFELRDFYSDHIAHVLVGDGAYLVPDDAGQVGKHQFFSAFLTLEGVDPKLISDVWVHNYYRWIVWKLAAYDLITLVGSSGRYLTPEMVMLQLKYRYDREIDLCQRSALKKILERDDAPGKRMVLCVANIIKVSNVATGLEQAVTYDLDAKVLLEVTDGWYSIKSQIDVPLTDLVRQGKITVGQKICVSGAELVGGEDACSPLEAPDSIMLKISYNSCRPAPWDSVLGYQLDPRPLCVPLTGLASEGGTIGVVDLIIVRKYPVMYMEKLPGGGCVFRTGKAEEKTQQVFQGKQQESMEKLYRKIEEEVEKEEKEERRSVSKKKWSRSEVEYLQSGRQIYEALMSTRQPDLIENLLTERQISKLMDYKRQLQDEKQQNLNSRFHKAWQDREQGPSERNVTPLLKFRVAGCAHRDMDTKTSTILTIWRPAPEICELQEGKRYKVYNLNTNSSRSKYVGHDVQLTAIKQTKFRLMNIDENFLDSIFEPREVLWVSDICRRQPPYGEVDFVGVIVMVSEVSHEESRQPDTVYCADCQGNLIAVKFWQGLKAYDGGLLSVGNIICCSNLMDKSQYRSRQLPAVEASNEFTHITNKPQNSEQRQAVARLNTALKDRGEFMERATSLLTDTLDKRQNVKFTPEKRRFITSMKPGSISPAKTVANQTVPGMKYDTREYTTTKDDSLSMSIDSSFDEEISKADLENDLMNPSAQSKAVHTSKGQDCPGDLVVNSAKTVCSEIAEAENVLMTPSVQSKAVHTIKGQDSPGDLVAKSVKAETQDVKDISGDIGAEESFNEEMVCTGHDVKNNMVDQSSIDLDINPVAVRETKIPENFGLSISDRVKGINSSENSEVSRYLQSAVDSSGISSGVNRGKGITDIGVTGMIIGENTSNSSNTDLEAKVTIADASGTNSEVKDIKAGCSNKMWDVEQDKANISIFHNPSPISSHQNVSVLSSNQQAKIISDSDVYICEQIPQLSKHKHTGNRLKRTPKTDSKQLNSATKTTDSDSFKNTPKPDVGEMKLDAKMIHPEEANLVKSPEEVGTPELTPQTPSSQQNRAIYQVKMARLLTYGSPSTLTPIKTPVTRTVSKGFKPPAFIKK